MLELRSGQGFDFLLVEGRGGAEDAGGVLAFDLAVESGVFGIGEAFLHVEVLLVADVGAAEDAEEEDADGGDAVQGEGAAFGELFGGEAEGGGPEEGFAEGVDGGGGEDGPTG